MQNWRKKLTAYNMFFILYVRKKGGAEISIIILVYNMWEFLQNSDRLLKLYTEYYTTQSNFCNKDVN